MLADDALQAGDLGAYKVHIDKARDLVTKAIALEDAGSSATPPDSTPSGSETP